MKKLPALIKSESEESEKITDDVVKNNCIERNKTLIKKIKDCKPFLGVSILFLCVSIILIKIMTYLCFNLKNNVLPSLKIFKSFLVYIK